MRKLVVGTLLTTGLAASAAAAPPADTVTLRNGTIYAGRLSGGPLELHTEYGTFRLPRAWLQALRLEPGEGTDTVITVDGGRLHGRLADVDLHMERAVVGPPLPIDTADMAAVDFGGAQDADALQPAPDAVILGNGDRFRVQVLQDGLPRADGAGILGRGAVTVLDIVVDYEGVRGQWTRHDGARAAGPLGFDGVDVRTPGGGEYRLPVTALESIAYDLPEGPEDLAQAVLRHRFPARSAPEWFRDRMEGGLPGPALVRVPAGSYRRGDLQGDGDPNERPAARVEIRRPFAIGAFEVTFEEYARFCVAEQRRLPRDSDWGRGRRPVVNVSWEDAVAYTRWLSERTGRTYRLPTEAEWEYAARAGTDTRFWWGQEAGGGRANCAGCGSPWDGERTAPVGRFPANALGLFDTAGNVWEWVQDCYDRDYDEAPADGSAAVTAGCGKRVIRGGAWSFPPQEARSASRWRDFPARASDDTGFRVVRELEHD